MAVDHEILCNSARRARAARTITSPTPARQPLLRRYAGRCLGRRATAMLRRARWPLSWHLGTRGRRVNRPSSARMNKAWRQRRPSSDPGFCALCTSEMSLHPVVKMAAWWLSSRDPAPLPASRSCEQGIEVRRGAGLSRRPRAAPSPAASRLKDCTGGVGAHRLGEERSTRPLVRASSSGSRRSYFLELGAD